MMTSENWGVAVVSRRGARLFRGGPRSLVEFATVDDALHVADLVVADRERPVGVVSALDIAGAAARGRK